MDVCIASLTGAVLLVVVAPGVDAELGGGACAASEVRVVLVRAVVRAGVAEWDATV